MMQRGWQYTDMLVVLPGLSRRGTSEESQALVCRAIGRETGDGRLEFFRSVGSRFGSGSASTCFDDFLMIATTVQKSQIPNGYKIIVERVAWLSSRSPKAIWSRVIKDVFVTKDAQRLYIRAECAIKLLSKLKTLPDYKAVSLIRQMSHHATTLIQDLCASENLVEHRHTQNGVYQIKSLLGKIAAYRKDLPATSAAVVACEQNVQASSAAVKRAAEQVAEAQKRWAKLHQQHTAKETALCLARREAMEGKQKVIHAADKALRTLDEHREKMQESIDAIYRVSVKAMTTNQVHLLVWRISRQTVSLERIEEHSIDGQLLIELTASDLMEMTGLQPLGLCHRVVHYAKMAADTAQPELLELYYGQYVQALNDWLLEQSDETGNQYAPQLKAQQVDIFTIGSMSVRDLADLQVKPKDRRRMLELAIEASASVTIPLTEAAKSEPQMSVEHQRRLLIEKQALAERLATVEKERDGMERLRRQQQAIADQEEKKHIQVASDFLDEVTRRTELEELLQQQNEQLHCPITMRLMEDPVMAEDGHVYERDAITNWVEKKGTSPMTQVVMGDKLQPVLLIKQLMAQSKEIARRKR
eukprot:TRINITY_DN11260_c0_g3_i4.p1 TRINITY_DN11260_c0_g3~~TRINITY_DN11260_c0_g3_i4.p1  ORF type:complete len:587 (+),score=96.26 TRINITY_DN11260_c0_g3_i4:649-2409(+)